jgi:hypothetical protein
MGRRLCGVQPQSGVPLSSRGAYGRGNRVFGALLDPTLDELYTLDDALFARTVNRTIFRTLRPLNYFSLVVLNEFVLRALQLFDMGLGDDKSQGQARDSQ